jgi:hypothetical protein
MNAITNWFDKVLVPEWRKTLKMLSFWWSTLCAAAVPAWLMLPEDQKAAILGAIGINPGWIIAASFVISIVLRLKSQGLKEEPDKVDPS